MNRKGLEAIYRALSKSKIKEVLIKSNKGTEVRIVRSDDEINMNLKNNISKKTKEIIYDNLIDQKKINKFDITSPEIGFFHKFNPKSKQQFFKLRDVVEKGEIVAIIISLNIHHNVVADQRGKILEFLVENDQPVVYNQPLIRLEKIPENE